MTTQTVHVWGFAAPTKHPDELVSGVGCAFYDTSVADSANGVIDKMRELGYVVNVSTLRSLDGWLQEVTAVVERKDKSLPMWHLFTTPKNPWPMTTKGF